MSSSSNNNASVYFCRTSDERVVKIYETDLIHLIVVGKINAQTLICAAGESRWQAVGTIPQFAGFFSNPVVAPPIIAQNPEEAVDRKTSRLLTAALGATVLLAVGFSTVLLMHRIKKNDDAQQVRLSARKTVESPVVLFPEPILSKPREATEVAAAVEEVPTVAAESSSPEKTPILNGDAQKNQNAKQDFESTPVVFAERAEAGTRLTFTINDVEFAFRYCPPGTFEMGPPESRRQVTLTRGFYILENEIENRQYQTLTPRYDYPEAAPSLPATDMSWLEAVEYVEKLNAGGYLDENWTFALPTEAQWEYACRAGVEEPESAILLDDFMWCRLNSDSKIHETKTKQPNAWGVFDMRGNVREWCADWKAEFSSLPQTDPVGPQYNFDELWEGKGLGKVLRGGAYDSLPQECASTKRDSLPYDSESGDVGFRVVIYPINVGTSAPQAQKSESRQSSPQNSKPVATAPRPKRPTSADLYVPSTPLEKPYLKSRLKTLAEGRRAGERKVLTLVNLENNLEVDCAFRWIPPGSFEMGLPLHYRQRRGSETPHDVVLSRGFWMLEIETTQAMWCVAMGENPSYHAPGAPGARKLSKFDAHWGVFPVERVSWLDAQLFLERLNENGCAPKGWFFRLPTEAEWEYACRAGTKTAFPFGDSLNGIAANCSGGSPYGDLPVGPYLGSTTPARNYPPNPWGLFDMIANVEEWCADGYDRYREDFAVDPLGSLDDQYRVLRGGGWSSPAHQCLSGYRGNREPNYISDSVGFRFVLAPIPETDEDKDEAALRAAFGF